MARDRDDDITNRPRRERDDDRPRRERDDDDFDDLPRKGKKYLREVAGAQKGILYCILGQFALVPLNMALQSMPPDQAILANLSLGVVYLAVAITAAVFTFMLSVKVYGPGTGVVLGILTLIPCIGLIVLLFINQKATGVLKAGGVRVGLMGANGDDLR